MGSAPKLELIADDLHADLVGTVVAERYRLERPIGSGGMATIWAATHLALDQPVALKLLEVAGPQTQAISERFLREARIAASVRHRNVVDIIDFGSSKDGQPFMAMSLLEGMTLAQRMDAGPLTVADVVRHMARVLSGLGAVHDAGLVHRDLKPENIFLVEDADGVYPKLLDFGISRSLHSGIKSVLPTMENAIVGTPQYMSPEQARGLQNLDHRSDLWSVGVMLFELLTGVLPYDSDAVGDIIIQIATGEPPEFASLRPDLAGPLEQVVKTAMSRAPDDRYASARDMRAALLTAVAATAANLQAAKSYGRFDTDTPYTADGPEPVELLEAVGSAYEPGDSSMLDFSEHMHLIESWRPPAPGRIPPPPPALRGDPFTDPFADPVAQPAAAEPAAAEPAAMERSPRRSPLLLIVPALLVLGAVGAGVGFVLASGQSPSPALSESRRSDPIVEPPPSELPPGGPATDPGPSEEPAAPAVEPAPVTVTLDSVPLSAEIFVDGLAWAGGPEVELARGDAAHTIEVRVADGRSWTQEHTATADGRYSVALTRRRGRTSPRGARANARRGGAGAGGGSASDGRQLIRDPGF